MGLSRNDFICFILRSLCAIMCLSAFFISPTPTQAADSQPAAVSFVRDVAPILLQHCQECHGPGKSKGKFRLDAFARLTQPGDSSHPSIAPGHPETSEVFRLISTTDEEDRMPKKADRLPEQQ